MNIAEFAVKVGDEMLSCSLASPEQAHRSAESGLLLNISATRQIALCDPSQNHPTRPFLEAGHYALSFDLPHHGERVKEFGDQIEGLTATWRQDGFVSLEADLGACSTLILTFAGSHLELNAWTRLGGDIRVELADASDDNRRVHAPPIKGRSFQDCDPISGDHLDQTVTWRGESDLSAWTDRPIRVRFQMRRARLYAMQFV